MNMQRFSSGTTFTQKSSELSFKNLFLNFNKQIFHKKVQYIETLTNLPNFTFYIIYMYKPLLHRQGRVYDLVALNVAPCKYHSEDVSIFAKFWKSSGECCHVTIFTASHWLGCRMMSTWLSTTDNVMPSCAA